jgi:hypothetical protein
MDGWKVVLSRAKQQAAYICKNTQTCHVPFYLEDVHDSKQEGSREKAWRTCFHIITDESSKIVPAQQTTRLFLVDMHNSNQEEGLRNLASSL